MKRRFALISPCLLVLCSFLAAQETVALPHPSLDAARADGNYEANVLRQIDTFLKTAGATERHLTEAEDALRELLLVHLKAREHRPFEKSANDRTQAVMQQIADQLVSVRSDLLKTWASSADNEPMWASALRQSEQWLRAAPNSAALSGPVQQLWISRAENRLKSRDFVGARRQLDHVDATFTSSSPADAIREGLKRKAEELYLEAKQQTEGGVALLQEALALWPNLTDARLLLEARQHTLRQLVVSYPGPAQTMSLSPATAFTDLERQCLPLLFQSLVTVQQESSGDLRYRPQLAAELPSPQGSLLNVELRRDALWSDGTLVRAADVRHTAQLLSASEMTGRSPVWRDVLEVPRLERGQIAFTLRQSNPDPLAALRFYILPQKFRDTFLTRADDPEFAKSPVGSGPYQLKTEAGVQMFAQNFAKGAERRDSIHLLSFWPESATPSKAQLRLDVPDDRLSELKKAGYDIRDLLGRRMYFLGANHRVAALANQNLRRALALAIPRDEVLDKAFRIVADGRKYHRQLNGLFPPDSWAQSPPPSVAADLFQPELARSLARQAVKELGKIHLTLKCPKDGDRVVLACQSIVDDIAKNLESPEIQIQVLPLAMTQFESDLEMHKFDLIYHHFDFDDDRFSLRSLFDTDASALAPKGSNFLGYADDSALTKLLRLAATQERFSDLRETQQTIHAHLIETMPLIPLWQLHYHIAIDPDLYIPNTLNPEAIFADIDEWRLKK